MLGARLIHLRRHNPHIIGQGFGNTMQGRETMSARAVVVGDEDTHFFVFGLTVY